MSNRGSDPKKRNENNRVVHWEKVEKFENGEVKDHFDAALAPVNDLFDTAEKMSSEGKKTQAESIWRSQIILLASALDFYMHEITKYGLDEIYSENWDHTEPYDRLMVPMKSVEKGIFSGGKNGWLLEYVDEKYSRTSLIAFRNIDEQLSLLGIEIARVAEKVYPDCPGGPRIAVEKLKGKQKDFCDRRNAIAHQTDKDSKNAVEKDIEEKDVKDFVSYITDLVCAIDAAVEEKDKKA